MAFTKIHLKHPEFELTKEVPVGFSWTVFFWGMFPALFRSDWKWALIMFFLALVTFGFSFFVFMFIYNKLYMDSLLEQGYASVDSEAILGPVEAKLGTRIPRRT